MVSNSPQAINEDFLKIEKICFKTPKKVILGPYLY